MSKVIVFGSTGYAGSAITRELLARGHEVIGVSRHPDAAGQPGLTVRAGSVVDADLVRDVVADADQVVLALHAAGDPALVTALPAIIDATVAAGARLGVVGGAGSLQVAEGGPRLFDTPGFPEAFRPEARAHGAVLEALRETSDLDWFYLSPAAGFGAANPGERTGRFRLGGDVLLSDADGNSAISGADYAIAFVDEVERGEHRRERFSVAY